MNKKFLLNYWYLPVLIILGFVYLGVQCWSLVWYPFVHSDEVWLASLSRTMFETGNLGVTEEFFVLTPRFPHAIKTLFHLIQGFFLSISWSILTVRLLSLFFGLASLLVFMILLRTFVNKEPEPNYSYLLAFLATLAWALDPWFFLTSRMGRQESWILFCMMVALWAVLSHRILVAGLITGIAIFVHPNSFLIAWSVLPWVIYLGIRKKNLGNLAGTYILTTGIFALLALGLSLFLDPQFIQNYLAFGLEVGVGAPPAGRIQGFLEYLARMTSRTAGTYLIPPFGSSFLLFLVSWGLMLVVHDWKQNSPSSHVFKSLILFTLTLVSVSFGLLLIGKFSPTATVFLLPWGYGAMLIFGKIKPILTTFIFLAIIFFNGLSLAQELKAWNPNSSSLPENSYHSFIEEIQTFVGLDGRVLANLNTGFAFEAHRLLAIRDLGFLPPVEDGVRDLPVLDRPLGTFVVDQHIRWVLINHQELELIYSQRPAWNLVYGNPYRFYPDLLDLVQDYGQLVGIIQSPWYAQRLVPFMSRTDSQVLVYRLELPEN